MQLVKMFSTLSCPYCVRAKALLKQRGVEVIEDVRVDLEPAQRQTMVELIFIGGILVGGCDDLVALDQRGGLVPLLAGAAASL
jgi:glutaredoxin 3